MFTIDGVAITIQELIEKIPPTFSERLMVIVIVGILLFLGTAMLSTSREGSLGNVFWIGCAILTCTLTWMIPNVIIPLFEPPNIQYEIVKLETPKEEYYYKTESNDLPKVLYQNIKGQGDISGGGTILGSSIQTDNTQFYQLEVLKDGLLSLTNIPTTMVKKKEVPNNEEDIYKVEAVYKEVPMIFSENQKIDTKIKETIAGTNQATQFIVDYYIVEVPKD